MRTVVFCNGIEKLKDAARVSLYFPAFLYFFLYIHRSDGNDTSLSVCFYKYISVYCT